MAFFAGACDRGTQDNASLGIGPPIHVVGFNGASGDAGPQMLPADGVIQIAFDRLLHPASVTRQSFSLEDESGNFPEPIVTYDPVARVVTLSSPDEGGVSWLMPGVTYTVTIGVSAMNDYTGGSGPRAIDGAVLPAQVQEVFQAYAPSTPTPSPNRPIDFCDDVLPIFQLRCSGPLCHAAPVASPQTLPAEGLVLETSDGVLNTAIGRVSQESNTGPLATPPQVQAHPFGVDMAIVGPGNPGASWLMYKVLLGQRRPIDQGLDAGMAACGSASAPLPVAQLPTPQPAADLALPASEQAILAQYILGNQMPYPLNLPPNVQTPVGGPDDESSTLPLPFDELERVRAWIAQGANVTECTSCPQ